MSGNFNRGSHTRSAWLRRLLQLHLGLVAFGFSLALMVRADLGLGPWDVLHQGLAAHLGVRIGWVVIGVGALALLGWIPLRQRPGFGTVSNVIVVGVVVNASLSLLPHQTGLPLRVTLLTAGIVANAAATALYIGAGLGPGPRDGLMTGLAARGHSLRAVRTAIELTVLALGVLFGGTAGIGTVAYALTIGPLAHRFMPWLTFEPSRRPVASPVTVGLADA